MKDISQEMKEIKEAMQDKMMSPSQCLHGSCVFGIDNNLIPIAPAKTDEELLKVIDSTEAVSIFLVLFLRDFFEIAYINYFDRMWK